mmetsp:Transcript_63979/g.183788  ORF Transcript_63979/g.183788 Transcript_63979/m.183788 type:complete len:232 (+) Transcript_63979:177-872(+)
MEVAMALALVGALPKAGLEFEGAQGILGSTPTIPRTPPCPLPRQSAGGSNGKFSPDDVMADADTRKTLAKVLRAFKHVMSKKVADAHPLFGAGSTAVSMVFTLQKFPCKLKTLRIPLPTPLFENREAEGLFLKTAKAKKVLAVQFGWGAMAEVAMAKNALAVIEHVRTSIGARSTLAANVEADGVSLPFWSQRQARRRRESRSLTSTVGSASNRASMPPPAEVPCKRARTF